MWLLEPITLKAMRQAIAKGITPTAEQQLQFEARSFSEDGPRLLTVAGDSAEIDVSGVITKAPSWLAMLFGGGNTTYPEIISAVAAAEQDPDVKTITMRIDSPGGHIDGLFDTLAAIQATTKPIKAIATNVAASAAFALGAQADEFVASNRATRLGSVGIVVGVQVDDSIVEITSTEAPDKRPDATTDAGKATIRVELDAMHALFAESIATGRKTTVENVNTNFGRGATMLADEALKQGMIDSVAGSPPVAVKTPSPTGGGKAKGANAMDKAQFKAEYPAVHAEVFGAGLAAGVTQERDRCGSFVVAGEQSGDMKTALGAIKDGSEMTGTLTTQFLMAAANRGDVTARGKDADEVDAALAAAALVEGEAKDKGAAAAILKGFAATVGAEVPNA